jgi:hypothetical protein
MSAADERADGSRVPQIDYVRCSLCGWEIRDGLCQPYCRCGDGVQGAAPSRREGPPPAIEELITQDEALLAAEPAHCPCRYCSRLRYRIEALRAVVVAVQEPK